MIDIVVLQDTLNPISAQERVKINQNWNELRRGFSSLQNQISFLAGGVEVDEIVARIERVIQDAETNTQNAIDNVNNNYAEKLVEINQSLTDLSAALTNSQMATNQANEARDNAVNATNDALTAINQIQLVISNLSSRGDFVLGTQYYKGNIVSNGQGSSYIAKQDNINLPLTNTTNWTLLASRGLQGIQGEKGDTGSGFLVKGYFANLQELESAIPSPETGDAYGIGIAEPYDIYIYDGINNIWVNNGALQGAKGDRGERGEVGPEGPPGETQDLMPIQNQLDNHETRIANLENREVITKSDVSGLNREVAYLKLQQEASQRIEGGTVFADDFNGSRFGFELKQAKTESNVALNKGETILTGKINAVRDGVFSVGSKITIMDAENHERVSVTRFNVAGDILELEVSPLDNSYVSGALIAESTIDADGTFPNIVSLDNTVATDANVVNSAYTTIGNGGRKMTKLENGWIVAALRDNVANSYKISFYVLKSNDGSWEPLAQESSLGSNSSLAIASKGNTVHVLYTNSYSGSSGVLLKYFDATTISIDDTINNVLVIEPPLSTNIFGNVSLVYDSESDKFFGAWSSKVSSYSTAFNIRYASSLADSGTWSAVEQLTKSTSATVNLINPSICVRNGLPIVLLEQPLNGSSGGVIFALVNNGSSWSHNGTNAFGYAVVISSTHTQTGPSLSVASSGTVHVAWHARDAQQNSIDSIRYSNSSDAQNYKTVVKLVQGKNPSISEDADGKIFITYENNGSIYYIVSTNDGLNWSDAILKTTGTNPSALNDRSIIVTVPPSIQSNVDRVSFNGNLSISRSIPAKYANAFYSIPQTDYVGVFVKKTTNSNVQAYLNDQIMTSELNGDEYTFEGQLSVASPANLMLELSRTDMSNGSGDGLTRILGGRS